MFACFSLFLYLLKKVKVCGNIRSHNLEDFETLLKTKLAQKKSVISVLEKEGENYKTPLVMEASPIKENRINQYLFKNTPKKRSNNG